MQSVKNQRGVSLISMVISVVIIAFLCYFAVKVYFRKPPLDKDTKQEMEKQGINSDNKLSMIESAREKVKSFNKNTGDRLKQSEQ